MPNKYEKQLIELGKRLKYLRKQHKITQAELALKVNLDVKTINRIEAGTVNTGITTIFSILEALNENITNALPELNIKQTGKSNKNTVIAWWSGGVTSAVACKWALDTYLNVEVVFIDTKNEDPDTYRFLKDCSAWYGRKITSITSKYNNITEVWDKYKTLNTANGAICSSELKRTPRVAYQDLNKHFAQVFGFDITEKERHRNMRLNYPEINNISPLIDLGLTKADCIKMLKEAKIAVPAMYKRGFSNNNCYMSGCIRGGAGYWQKIQREEPKKFNQMAELEQKYTKAKKQPVTVLRIKRDGITQPCFLKPMKGYKYDLGMISGREPEALVECSGFCYTKPEIEEVL